MDLNLPLVSVCMITYNHEPFVSRAIEGVLLQQTDFPIELVISEDGSDDQTRAICERYAKENPEIVRLLPFESNLGMNKNLFRVFEHSRADFIGVCEGDDYWTDPLKLQKQLTFLKENREFSFCYHRVGVLKGGDLADVIPKAKSGPVGMTDLLSRQNNKLVSMFFRKTDLLFDYHRFPIESFATPDFRTSMILSSVGRGYLLDHTMAIYRWHTGGIYSALSEIKKLQIGIHNRRAALQHIPMNFKQQMICRLMIGLRQLKILLLKMGWKG